MRQEDIQLLLERYLDGSATDDEELALRRYFATAEDVPAGWRAYRALFGYVAQQSQEGTDSVAHVKSINQQSNRWLRKAIAAVATAAACAALVLVLTQRQGKDAGRNYAVIDGQTVTSSQVVAQEAELALQMVSTGGDELEALELMWAGEDVQ